MAELKKLTYDGKEVAVECANRDFDGNVINDTYSTKEELTSTALSIQSSVDKEKERAKNAEEALTKDLAAEVFRAKEAEEKLTTDLSAEASARKSADNILQTNITIEVDRAKAAEGVIANDLTAEASTRQTNDETLQSNIDAEAKTREANDNAIQSNLDAEISRAQVKESELETAISEAGKIDDVQVNGTSVVTDKVANVDLSNYVTLDGEQTITGQKTFNDILTIKSDKYIKTDEIDNANGNALVRYKATEGKNVFGGVNYDNVLMGKSDRPFYSKDGSDFNGSEMALRSDVESKFDLISNLENGSGSGSAQMKQDGTSGTFSFTDKNANATALDGSLTGDINYGAVGAFSASFGGKSSAQGKRSMAVGTTTIAKGAYSFASGDNSVALGNDSHAEGYSTVTGPKGAAAHSEGYNTQALGHSSHSEGNNTIANGDQSHAEGVRTAANGGISHAEGVDTKANADNSHAEGNSTATKTALPSSSGSGSSGGSSGGSTDNPDDTSWNIDEHRGVSSHAEGVGSTTYGYASHAEGFNSVAYGHLSHAEGDKAVTGTSAGSDGWAAHAEGQNTIASGNFSHAEGQSTTASGIYSHTGGINTSASGMGSFAHGNNATASGNYSVAFGRDTSANHDQFALGIKNVASEKALLMVGNNKSTNAFEVLSDGRAKVQSAPTESNDVATKDYVDNGQLSAVEEANTYTDENLNNYYNKTAANNAFAEGPYKFVKVLDNSIVNNTPLTPDINIGIVESSVSATVTYKAVLWKNSIDNTYKITMDIKSTSMTSCTLKPKALKIALVNYASTWRVPTVYMKNICANAMSQMSKWGVANCWVSNLSGRCLRDETTNIGKLNANGLEQVIVNGMDNTNICLAVMLAEFDTDHVSDNLPIKGFSYHVELLTSKTTL